MAKIKKPTKKDILIADLLASLREIVQARDAMPESDQLPTGLAVAEMWDRAGKQSPGPPASNLAPDLAHTKEIDQ